MCAAVILFPPTAFAMSYRSVVLVTTLSCAVASETPVPGSAPPSAAACAAIMKVPCVPIYLSSAPAAPPMSEWMRFVRSERERGLQQNAVRRRALGWRITLVSGQELRELTREVLEIPRSCG